MDGRAPGFDLESAGKETARAQCRVNSERTQRVRVRCIEHRDPNARARYRAPGPGTESAADRHVRRAPAANITTKRGPGPGTASTGARRTELPCPTRPGGAKPKKRPGPSPIKSGPECREARHGECRGPAQGVSGYDIKSERQGPLCQNMRAAC